jgi:hypothetical protein
MKKYLVTWTNFKKQWTIYLSKNKYLIEKIKEEQGQADSNIKSGDLMSAMAHKLTADWYSSMVALL